MAKIESNGLTLEVEEHGKPGDPAVLLIMGLAVQLTHWPTEFIESLVDSGYRVVTFDNRDIGLSEKLGARISPHPLAVSIFDLLGLASLLAPYKLTDMAADTAGILDALGIKRAHVIGVSMGGMIAQILCADYADRVASLTAIMSSTNNPQLPKAHPSITKEIIYAQKFTSDREQMIENTLRAWQLIGTKDSGRDAAEFRQQVADAIDRSTSPAGIRRQIAAIIATRDLREWTRRISAPSLVIHGSDDPLVPESAGHDIAACIDGARLEIVEGLGHDLPPRHLPTISKLVSGHLNSVRNLSTTAAA